MQSVISAMDVLQHNNLLHEVNQCAWCNVQRDVTCSESQYIGRRSVTHMILTHHEKEAFSFLQHLMTEERTVIFTVTFWTEQRKTEPVTTTRPKKTWDSRMETWKHFLRTQMQKIDNVQLQLYQIPQSWISFPNKWPNVFNIVATAPLIFKSQKLAEQLRLWSQRRNPPESGV